jgi:hypothetical protein
MKFVCFNLQTDNPLTTVEPLSSGLQILGGLTVSESEFPSLSYLKHKMPSQVQVSELFPPSPV